MRVVTRKKQREYKEQNFLVSVNNDENAGQEQFSLISPFQITHFTQSLSQYLT